MDIFMSKIVNNLGWMLFGGTGINGLNFRVTDSTGDQVQVNAPNIFVVGVWTLVVGTYNFSGGTVTLKIYANGRLVSTISETNLDDYRTSADFTIGSS